MSQLIPLTLALRQEMRRCQDLKRLKNADLARSTGFTPGKISNIMRDNGNQHEIHRDNLATLSKELRGTLEVEDWAEIAFKNRKKIEAEEKSPKDILREATGIQVVLEEGKTEIPKLLDSQKQILPEQIHTADFDNLTHFCQEIDRGLMPIIRDLRQSPEVVSEAYSDLLNERLRKKNVSFDKYLQLIHEKTWQSRILRELPKPDLVVDISKYFEKVTYTFDDTTIAVDSPQLLWDCHCKTPTGNTIEFECPIHKHPSGAEVTARFRNGQILIKYRGLRFYWHRGPELWPPSIDSFSMLNELEQTGLFTEEFESLLDIGSGTGFLGITTLALNPNIISLDLSDWLLTPQLYGLINWLLNKRNRTYVSVTSMLGLFTKALELKGKPYDVVLCNPPYLPLLEGYDDLGFESTVAGTDLLKHVIRKSSILGRNVYLQFSDLAKVEAIEEANKAGVKLRPLGKKKLVPFRITILWNRTDYLKVLIDKCGLIEKKNNRHRYWHNIQTYLIES